MTAGLINSYDIFFFLISQCRSMTLNYPVPIGVLLGCYLKEEASNSFNLAPMRACESYFDPMKGMTFLTKKQEREDFQKPRSLRFVTLPPQDCAFPRWRARHSVKISTLKLDDGKVFSNHILIKTSYCHQNPIWYFQDYWLILTRGRRSGLCLSFCPYERKKSLKVVMGYGGI